MKKLIYLSVLICSFLFIHTKTFAQNYTWEKMSGPWGGTTQIQEGKNGVLFANFSEGRLFRSVDGGLSWVQVNNLPVSSQKFTVGFDGRLFFTTNLKVYFSEDNGDTWEPMNLNFHVSSISTITSLPNGSILVMEYSGLLHRTLDKGNTWSSISVKPNYSRFFYDTYKGNLYVAPNYSSIDTFSVFRSTNNGESWKLFGNFKHNYYNLSMTFSPKGTTFIGVRDLILRSSDDGITWQTNDLGESTPYDCQVFGTNDGKIYAQKWYKIYESNDDGITWNEKKDINENISTIQVFKNGTIYGKSGHGMYRSIDKGKTWEFATKGINMATIIDIEYLADGGILTTTPDGLFAYDSDNATWKMITQLSTRYSDEKIPQIEVAPNGHWYYYDSKNIIEYDQNGSKLDQLKVPLSNWDVADLQINPATGTFFLDKFGGSFRSEDNGRTWNVVIPDLVSFSFLSDNSIVATGNNGLFRSTDDGKNWQRISSQQASFLTQAPSGALYYMGEVQGQLATFRSLDAGFTWDFSISEFPANIFSGYVLKNNAAGHLFSYDYFGSSDICASFDEGLTYHKINIPLRLISVIVDISPDQKIYLLSQSFGLYRTSQPTTNINLLKGQVFNDSDKNCNYDNEAPVKGLVVKATQGSETVYGYTTKTGDFALPVGNGSYDISVVTPNDYRSSCKVNVTNQTGGGNIEGVKLGVKTLIECPLMEVQVGISFLRRCFENSVVVSYCNKGTITAKDAYIEVDMDPFLEFLSASMPVFSQVGKVLRFNLGDVEPGTCGNIVLRCRVSCDAALGQIHCVKAHIYPDEPCPVLPRPQLRTTASCTGDSILLTIQNIGKAAMSAPRQWYAIEGFSLATPLPVVAKGEVQLGAGQSFTTKIAAMPWIQMTAQQDPNAYSKADVMTDIRNCGVISQPLFISSYDGDDGFNDEECMANIGSFDPNDKQGFPIGLTNKHYIEEEQELEYLIRFQNTGTDTAFNITIRDTLPIHLLDASSVRAGISSHPYTFRITPNGVLLFTFENILLPDSNINEANSHGFVRFKVKQQPNNVRGSKIENRAAIYFDFNEPVITNTTLHTVGIPISVSNKEPYNEPAVLLSIAPNPMHETATVTLTGEIPTGLMRMECYDHLSRLVRSAPFNSNVAKFDSHGLPSGLYHISIKTEYGQLVASGKIIIK